MKNNKRIIQKRKQNIEDIYLSADEYAKKYYP